ncbi:MAG: PD-(D/E)XK nuclease family protein [Ignavibacteriae bacterium]|nr:PD-(D/E)XK nuclease family protein [Ignavibacteriota bacterium]
MKDLLINIAGLSSEDLTTEVLRIILTDENYAVYQRLFYNYFFGDNINKSTKELKYEIITQKSFFEGRPDIIIEGGNEIYIIENKFYAGFSQGDQIKRYKDIINRYYKEFQRKEVLLLTTDGRKKFYEELLNNDGISIRFLSWNFLLDLFYSNDFLISALSNYIYYNFILQIEFSKKELEMLNTTEIPNTIDKLLKVVDKIKTQLQDIGFKVGRTSQSINFYGYFVENDVMKIWFGYGLLWWQECTKVISPLFIQIREDFSPVYKFDDNFISVLLKMGFFESGKNNWIKPIDSNLYKDETEMAKEIKKYFDELIKHIIK